MKLTFSDRIALVSGAGRGIGKAIAEKLAEQGCTVICVSKNPSSCGAVADEINAGGGKAKAFAFDVSDPAQVKENVANILKEFGKVDILVNNAGITRDNLMMRMSDEEWQSVINTNLSSCFYLIRDLSRAILQNRWGRIVNISSVSGVMGNAGQANYSSAKAGIIGLTKTLAREFASRSITVNAIAPGFIKTDMTAVLSPAIMQKAIDTIPLKRMGLPEEIANLCVFLCSEEAGYITGQTISVDGGLAM